MCSLLRKGKGSLLGGIDLVYLPKGGKKEEEMNEHFTVEHYTAIAMITPRVIILIILESELRPAWPCSQALFLPGSIPGSVLLG